MTAVSDFVQVQLSATGIAFAGKGATLRVGNGHFDYTFMPGAPVRVLTSEWRKTLSLKAYAGQPILEVAPTAAAAPAKPVAAASHTISPAVSHTDPPPTVPVPVPDPIEVK